jgi:hypothetical protein
VGVPLATGSVCSVSGGRRSSSVCWISVEGTDEATVEGKTVEAVETLAGGVLLARTSFPVVGIPC